MREGETTRQCDLVVKQTFQDAENKNPTMHITCINEGEKSATNCKKNLLGANDIDEPSQPK